jgi:hypothetical protein
MRLNGTLPWLWVLAASCASVAAAGDDLQARCRNIGALPLEPFEGDAYRTGRTRGWAAAFQLADQQGVDIDAEVRRALANDGGGYRPSLGPREEFTRGFADGFEVGFCDKFARSRRTPARRVWDPGLGKYREEKPGQVWDPALGRYQEEKPGQVWDPALGRYRDRDPRDGPPPEPPSGRHRHGGQQGWCTKKH